MVGYTSLEEINRLTREFRQDIIQPDGSIELKEKHIKYSSIIHFDIPNLDYDVLFELPRFLVRTTIFPRGVNIGNTDRPHFWTWMAEICNYSKWDFKYRDRRFPYLFNLLISSHLASISTLPLPLNFYQTQLLSSFHIFAACFAFPFLEKCLRTKCYKYVSEDGVVLKNFTIQLRGRKPRLYTKSSRISNITHELKLLDHYVATSFFRKRLQGFMDELNKDSGMRLNDSYELISKWRNPLLHGEQFWSTGRDAVTYLICMMLLSEISQKEYESKIDDLKENIKWKQKTASPFLWYNYKLQ